MFKKSPNEQLIKKIQLLQDLLAREEEAHKTSRIREGQQRARADAAEAEAADLGGPLYVTLALDGDLAKPHTNYGEAVTLARRNANSRTVVVEWKREDGAFLPVKRRWRSWSEGVPKRPQTNGV